MKIIEQSQFIRKAKDKVFEEILNKYNLTNNELSILIFLYENEPENNTASNIVRELLFTKSHVSLSVESLIKKEYIIKNIDKDDKKRYYLNLTKKANNIKDDYIKKKKEFLDLLFFDVEEKDKETMKRVFYQVQKNIDNILSK